MPIAAVKEICVIQKKKKRDAKQTSLNLKRLKKLLKEKSNTNDFTYFKKMGLEDQKTILRNLVEVNKSKLIPNFSQLFKNSLWKVSTISLGDLPVFSACKVIGVPWVSLPDTIKTLLPFNL